MNLHPLQLFRPSRRIHRRLLAGLCLAWLAAPAAHAYGIRTVIVSPVAGNPTASGTALLTALAGITTASATNPYLLKVEPGLYDVGATNLQMKEWVDIEGSGIDVTTIVGDGEDAFFLGVVEGASHTEIRHLTIRARGDETNIFAIGMSLFEVEDQRIYRVRFMAEGGSGQWGIRAVDSTLHVREAEVLLKADTQVMYGISLRGSPDGDSSLRDTRIVLIDGEDCHGLHFSETASFKVAERVSIYVYGTRYGAGIFYGSAYSPFNVGNVEFRDFDIESGSDGDGSGSALGAYGAYAIGDTDHTFVESRIRTYASNGDSIGLYCSGFGLGCPTRIDNSEIVTDSPGGADRAVEGSADLRIGTSLIEGSTAGSTGICAGVYDIAYGLYTAPACP